MKIGIVGGTFDPFHRGHLDPVLAARDLMEWRRVLYVPAARQPFKADQSNTSGYHRFAMAVLATEKFDDLYVSPRELERGQISYTVETLEELRAEHPHATLDWIIGDDNVAQLGSWKNIERIFELANFAVLARNVIPSAAEREESGRGKTSPLPDSSPSARLGMTGRITDPRKRGTHGSIVFARNPLLPISATEIRRRIRAGEPVTDLVDPRVSHYIDHYGLYREVQA